MNKTLRSVMGLLLLVAITSCSKTAIDPVKLPAIEGNFNTVPALNNIVVLGGSTAWGKGASSVKMSWVGKLQAKVSSLHKNDTIINLALSGYTTYQIMESHAVPTLKRPMADTDRNITAALRKKPIMVIISLPSNDIAANFSDEEILNNYKTVTGILKRENIPFFLTSNQPRNFSVEQRKRLKSFNTLLIKTFPGHVVDYLDKLGDASYLFKSVYNCGDGIHPNDKGHEVIYNTFMAYTPFKQALGF